MSSQPPARPTLNCFARSLRKYFVILSFSWANAGNPMRRWWMWPAMIGRSPPSSSLGMAVPLPPVRSSTVELGTSPAAVRLRFRANSPLLLLLLLPLILWSHRHVVNKEGPGGTLYPPSSPTGKSRILFGFFVDHTQKNHRRSKNDGPP